MARTVYRPETDGFAFTNSWSYDDVERQQLEQTVAELLPVAEAIASPIFMPLIMPFVAAEFVGFGPFAPLAIDLEIQAINNGIVSSIGNALAAGSYGRCGGMAFASLDYWLQQWIVPRGTGTADQPTRLTPQGTTLRNYIWDRLLDSVQDNAVQFLTWVIMAQVPFGVGASWLKDQTAIQFQNIKNGIDAGTPVPIGLVGTTANPFNDHQVLCYGYDDNLDGTGSLILYDNNNPDSETRIDFDLRGNGLITTTDGTLQPERGPLLGFFATVYSPRIPPKAVVLNRSLTISPGCVQEQLPFDASYSVLNVGYHQSPAMELKVVSGGDTLGGETVLSSLAEGAARTVDAPITLSGAGWRTLSVLADLGTPSSVHIVKQIPPADTQVGTAHINVLPQLRIQQQAPVAGDPCSIFSAQEPGATATFALRSSPPVPPGGTYQWSVAGATGYANNGPTFQVQLPPTAGAIVTVSVVITYGDGCRRGGSLTLRTEPHFLALTQAAYCRYRNELHSVFPRTHIPPKERPRSPIPVGGDFKRENLVALQSATKELMRGLDAALASSQGGEAVTAPVNLASAALRGADANESTLIMPLSSGSATGMLRLPSGKAIPIVTDRAEIGRGILNTEEAAAIDLSAEPDKATVSRIHALITRVGDRFEIEDLRSANGTVLNGQKLMIGQRYPLHNGDVLEFGKVRCVFARG